MENNELQHWGIKGMRWGRRRYQNKDGSLTPEGKKRYGDDDVDDAHEDYTKAHNSQSVRSMSDKELQNRLNRLRNEQQYLEMTTPQITKGESAVSKTLKEIGGNLAKEYTKKAASGLTQALIDKIAAKNTKLNSAFKTMNWVK